MGLPKREVARDGRASLPRDMVAAVGYENNVPNQRYRNTVDGTGNETEDLFVQIRIVFSTTDTLLEVKKEHARKTISGSNQPREVR